MQFFTRKYKNLRLVVEPRSTIVIEGVPIIKGLNNRFPLGLTVEFIDGQYKTNDPEIIKAIKKHPNYGTHFYAEDYNPEDRNEEGALADEEKKSAAERVGSQCPFCAEKFANKGLLAMHVKSCPKKDSKN